MEWWWQEASFTVAQTSSCDVMQEIIVTVAMPQCVCQHFWWTKVLTNTEMYRKMSGIPTKQLRCMTGSVSHHIAISVSSSPPLRSELWIEFLELDLIRWYQLISDSHWQELQKVVGRGNPHTFPIFKRDGPRSCFGWASVTSELDVKGKIVTQGWRVIE